MPRDGSGAFSNVPGTPVTPNTTIQSGWANPFTADVAATFNLAWPVSLGGTGGTSPSTALESLGGISKAVDQSAQALASSLKVNIINNTLQREEFIASSSSPLGGAGVSQMAFITGLGNFRKLRVKGFVQPTVDGGISAAVSTDAGVSYLTTLGNYIGWGNYQKDSALTPYPLAASDVVAMSAGALIAIGDGNGLEFELFFEEFNQAVKGRARTEFSFVSPASEGMEGTACTILNTTTPRNAFRISSDTGNICGYVELWGIRS